MLKLTDGRVFEKVDLISFEVTYADVANGTPHDGHYCPVAHALTRLFNERPFVGAYSVSIPDIGHWDLDMETTEQICKFDEDGVFKPGLYRLLRGVLNEDENPDDYEAPEVG